MTIYKSRLYSLLLMILLCFTGVIAGCAQASAPDNQTQGPVQTWMRQNAIPLQSVDPASSQDDLAPLQKAIGNATIVGLGEQTHGTHELYQLKARLAEFLISNMNFRIFVMENGWGKSQLIDAYINGGPGQLSDIMKNGLDGAWQTQEYQGMLTWMRAYNADPAHTTKIHFRGMDCQGASRNDLTAVINFLQKVDPANAAHVRDLYQSVKQKLTDQPQQVYNLLKAHQQNYEHSSSPQEFALALQNARIVVQAMTCFYASSGNNTYFLQRDTFMAENASWLYDHSGESQPKMIVWAHDMHIANNTSYNLQGALTGTNNLGALLRARYQQNYLALGTNVYHGSYTTYTNSSTNPNSYKPVQTSLEAPQAGTYTAAFGGVDKSLYALDLRRTPAGPVSNWFNSAHVMNYYGVSGQDLSTPGPVKHWFDIIVFLRDTTPSHSLLK
ncbi:succinoglycan biosynthesis protein [Dictyobacter sp. S3.2.2.5]|uniref:Succinoglycan biosynthesis protein n=1 Tax=Dictyobacter halimunensis TaxID=3026934 RepID=A0ABQ6G1X4_9CHLR|nr:succinoglycan biosynthesis protein [Dictyobacter sp. S3.2.2.5]